MIAICQYKKIDKKKYEERFVIAIVLGNVFNSELEQKTKTKNDRMRYRHRDIRVSITRDSVRIYMPYCPHWVCVCLRVYVYDVCDVTNRYFCNANRLSSHQNCVLYRCRCI